MVDQRSQPNAAADSAALAEVATAAGAMHELAKAIGELASAIRESATFAGEFELLPCDQINTVEDGETPDSAEEADAQAGMRTAPGWSTVLPMVPAQRRGEPVSSEESLCRPGGCGCTQTDTGQGRHARRDDTVDARVKATVDTEVVAR